MKIKNFLLIVLLLFVYSNVTLALEPGDTVPKLNVSKWLKGNSSGYDAENESSSKQIYVITFWASWNISSSKALKYLSFLKNEYKNAGVSFIAISNEKESVVSKFLKNEKKLDLNVAIDNESKTFNSFMGNATGLPFSFIVRDKALIWEGRINELNRVIPRLLGGSFDIKKQIKIEKFHSDLNTAVQYMDHKRMISTASEILKIDPTDRTALDMLVGNDMNDNKMAKALELVKNAIKGAGDNQYLLKPFYSLELSILKNDISQEGKKKIRLFAGRLYDHFSNDPSTLNEMAIEIINTVPLEVFPLASTLKIAKKATDLAAKTDNIRRIKTCTETLARVYYMQGRVDLAIKLQKKALSYNTAGDNNRSVLLLQFYESVKKHTANS